MTVYERALARTLQALAAKERDSCKLIQLRDKINAILQRGADSSQDTNANEKLTGTDGRPA